MNSNTREKRLLNCNVVDVNQLMPMKYHWAWEHYLNGCANHWMPTEVPMHDDIQLWNNQGSLTSSERLLIKRNLGFFSTAETLVANNLVLAIFKHITNPEARQYLLRQAFEEAIHTHAFHYIVESLQLDEHEIFNMYQEIPSIKEKDLFEMEITKEVLDDSFSTNTFEGKQIFLKNLIAYYVIMEGIFFYSGFAMVLSLHRRNKMKGIGEQFQYILRDETVHLNFGIDLINTIKQENPEVWTQEFQDRVYSLIEKAVYLEINYAKNCLPQGILGLSKEMFEEYIGYIADRRLERIGLQARYKSGNPFPWLSETIDLSKEKNFFETTITEYQSASVLVWD